MKMKNVKELLPIGSVVLLKKGLKKVMIIGILQQTSEVRDKVFDYVAVLYPEGYINEELKFLFDHEDINDVIFRGYENPERDELIASIDKSADKDAEE